MARLQDVIGYDTHANRPAASIAGRLFYETDTFKLFRDNSSSWDLIATGSLVASGGLAAVSNLSDVANAATALANLTGAPGHLNTLQSVSSVWAARTPAQVRSALGLNIGSNVQAWDSDLDTIGGLTPGNGNTLQSVSSAWAARTPAQVRAALGLNIGSDVEAWDADLDTIAGLTPGHLNVIQSVSSVWMARTPAQVQTLLVGTTAGTLAAGDDSRFSGITGNNQTGTSYTFVLADAGKVVEGNNASAITFTIPPVSSVVWPVGTVIEVWQQGAGQITIAAGAGVTLRSDGTKVKTTGQYATIGLRMRANDEWVLSGDLSA